MMDLLLGGFGFTVLARKVLNLVPLLKGLLVSVFSVHLVDHRFSSVLQYECNGDVTSGCSLARIVEEELITVGNAADIRLVKTLLRLDTHVTLSSIRFATVETQIV
jgi:hypothetical protein